MPANSKIGDVFICDLLFHSIKDAHLWFLLDLFYFNYRRNPLNRASHTIINKTMVCEDPICAHACLAIMLVFFLVDGANHWEFV